MNTEPLSPLDATVCGRCGTLCDTEDNFCRHCGLALGAGRLPSVRSPAGAPAVWQPRLRSVAVKGAAFVAAGTLAELLVRRIVRRALAPLIGRQRPAARRAELVRSHGAQVEPPQVESETLLLRHIRIRR